MPEPEEPKLTKKHLKDENTTPKTAKKKLSNNIASRSKKAKPNLANEIDLSKQLKQKRQITKKNKQSRHKSVSSEVKFCGNGKPMPSLAELEKMFEDSDNEDEGNVKQANNSTSLTAVTSSPVPEVQPLPEPDLTSPKTINKIANRLLDMVQDLTEPLLLDDDKPPQKIIKPKKHKKSGIPYIVGCKDRPYVPSRPNNNVFKGEEEYGVDEKNARNDEDDDVPQKRAKRTKGGNFSKSIFNAVADDIAAKLKQQEQEYDAKSDDSSKTVTYEYTSPKTNQIRPFSPLPSTSKDNDTFFKNDQLFNESLNWEKESSMCIDNDIEIVETPCETILVKDCDNTITSKMSSLPNDTSAVEIIEVCSVGTPAQATHVDTSQKNDDSVQFIDVKPASPILVEEYYSTITPNSVANDVDVCEVIDVDDVIAENAAILKKISNKKDLDKVTTINLSTPEPPVPKKRNISFVPVVPYSPYVPRTGPPPIQKPRTATEWAYSDMTPNSSEVVEMCERNIREIQKILSVGSSDKDLLRNTLYSLEYLSKARAEEAKLASTNSQCESIEDTNKIRDSGNVQEREKGIGDCPICMDVLSNTAIASTMCGHLFCMNCIKLAIKSNGKKCPTCRKSLKGAGFHQIFL